MTHNESVAKHYDTLDPFYRDVWGEHIHHGYWQNGDETPEDAVEKLIDAVADLAQISTGHRVLDVGCGYGGTARRLAAQRGAEVTGITIAKSQHEYAEAHGVAGTRFLLGDFYTAELPEGSFDAIVAIEPLEHFADKPGFFSRCRRLLRPGGRLVVAAWAAPEQPSTWQQKWFLKPIEAEGRLAPLPSGPQYARYLIEAGLELTHHEDLSSRVGRTWEICSRRLVRGLVTKPRYRQFLLQSRAADRVFAVTVLRMLFGFRVGAMRYVLFAGEKRITH